MTRHPVPILVVAGIPLATLAWQGTRLSTQVPGSDWLPASMDSARALRDLDTMERLSLTQGARVLLDFPVGTSALDARGWEVMWRMTRSLAADPRVARVRSLPALTAGNQLPRELLIALVPDSVRRAFVSADGRVALIEVAPRERVTANDLSGLVRTIRALDVGAVTGVPRASLRVGGLPAYTVDYEDMVSEYFGCVVLLVLGGTFLALLIGFRSVLVPIKAIVLNLLSVGLAYGAMVLVFQDGYGAKLFGLSAPLEGVFPAVPILVFCAVFGLSMDYEVFLVSRVAEARRAGLGERDSIVEGLPRSARLTTSAAAIMISVFGAFSFGDYLPGKLLGFSLAVAVVVDATVVRLALGPALLQLPGRWNWWPGDRAPGAAGASL